MFIASASDQRPGAPKRKGERGRVKGRQKEEERETDGGWGGGIAQKVDKFSPLSFIFLSLALSLSL